MFSLLSRPVSFLDIGINDADQDPNSALLELDKGLKSAQIGEQCEAISRFPNLFERYPFPILINSALLKLADVFRQEIPGSNFVRICVVEVIEKCGKHLDKLINVEEFLRRISAVMHSNDPMARALTLRTLGWICVVVGENRQVHHLIREALDAKDSVELQAAIFAAEKYAAKSKTFAINMCGRLTGMISGLATPVSVKLQLIQIFQHMHHDAETATTVRELCLKLLNEYPTQRVVITTLHTLTELAVHCLVDIPMQVDLLMSWLESESRFGIRRSILDELNILARKAPRSWTPDNLRALVKFAENSLENTLIACGALNILANLVGSPSFSFEDAENEKSVIKLGLRCIYLIDLKVATKGLLLVTNVIPHIENKKIKNETLENSFDCALNILQCIILSKSQTNLNSCMSQCLKCLVNMMNIDAENCESLCQSLFELLSIKTISDEFSEIISTSLASVGGSHANSLVCCVDKLIFLIQGLASTLTLKFQYLNQVETKRMVCLATLFLQMFHCHEWVQHGTEALTTAWKSVDLWAAYKISRQASRYGHHDVAHTIYVELSTRVCSDQQHFWLVALSQLSRGESLVQAEGNWTDNLTASNFFLHRALASLKAASSPNNAINFPVEFVTLRAEMFLCHAQLFHACLSLRTAPPPAIAATLLSSGSGRDDLLRCGRVVQQLSKSLKEFSSLSVKIGKLYQSSFDADPISLCNVSLMQEGANCMIKAIELIIRPTSTGALTPFCLESLSKKLNGKIVIEIESIAKALTVASNLLQSLSQVCTEVKPVREQHLQLLQDISRTLMHIPHPYPRFFFQRLQNTKITLNLSPQPRTPSDPVVVSTAGQLAIKVEGVIVHGKHVGLYRDVQTVTLALNSVIQNRPLHTLDLKIEPNEALVQTVTPHNDFFTAHFLIGFPIPGIYQVSVEASVTDTAEDSWKTGPQMFQSVKAQEDTGSKPVPTRTPVSQVPGGSFPAFSSAVGPSGVQTITGGSRGIGSSLEFGAPIQVSQTVGPSR